MTQWLEMTQAVWEQKGLFGVLVLALHFAIGAGGVLWLGLSIMRRLARATLRGIRRSRTRRFLKVHRGRALDGFYRDPAVHRPTAAPCRPHNGGPNAA